MTERFCKGLVRGTAMAGRGVGLTALGLGLACLAVAGCGPSDASSSVAVSSSSGSTHGSSNPSWSVAPSLEEQIFRSSVIVRATLQSATAAAAAGGGGYQAVQELRFTVHEYLKGSGPTSIVVAVRGGHGYLTPVEAQEAADFFAARRVTTWDDREGVLFLRNPSTPAGAAAGAAAEPTLSFTQSTPNQSPWAYSVDTLSRAWLPAQQAGSAASAAVTKTYITDGARTPPPTVTLADLRTKIATMAADLKAGAGVAEYEECVLGRIGHERHRRAVPWTPFQEKATLTSGAAAGTEVYRGTMSYDEPRYSHWWLSGPDAAYFQTAIVDADGQASNGYEHTLATARPLPAGEYRVHYNWQYSSEIPCNFKPDDTYRDWTVTVTAPVATLHEAFFDPVAIGTGVGAGGDSGALTPTAFSVGGASTSLQRLVWDGQQIQLDLSAAVPLSDHYLEFIGLGGAVGLRLRMDDATSAPTANGGQELRWRVCTAPWQAGDQLLLRLHHSATVLPDVTSSAPDCDPPAASR